MKKWISDLIVSAASVVFMIYCAVAFLSVPYFNYEYARQNGFISWLIFGQIVPTLKAPIWPYYALSSWSGAGGKMNESETAYLQSLNSAAVTRPLEPHELEKMESILIGFHKGGGNPVRDDQINRYLGELELTSEYFCAIGESALKSWGTGERHTTPDFDHLVQEIKAIRDEHVIKLDLAAIDAASHVKEQQKALIYGKEMTVEKPLFESMIRKKDLGRQNAAKIRKVYERVAGAI